jgi:hypothetical protein
MEEENSELIKFVPFRVYLQLLLFVTGQHCNRSDAIWQENIAHHVTTLHSSKK